MNRFINTKKVLFFILCVAAILRLWKLGSIPPHLSPDEAALGYNAYSVLKTGRDEYGTLLPIIFKSFGDYKPGLYVYLAVPFVATLGLNEYAVRLPSAIAGIIAVLLIYLIANELFKDKKFRIWDTSSPAAVGFGIWPAFLLALNPWHIYFSRGAWEANVSLTLTLAGVLLFLKALKKQKLLLLSSFFFALTLITYQGAKLATALVVLILVGLCWKKLIAFKFKALFFSAGVGILISLPVIASLFSGKAGRLTVFSVFSYPRQADYLQNFLNEGNEKAGGLTYYLFHSEKLNLTRGVLGRWFNHFSGRFLFFEGDWQNPRHSAPNQGMLLMADLILLIFGFISLVRLGTKKEVFFVFLWLALAPLPAALSRDQVQAVRAFNLSIPLVLITSLGLVFILNFINSLSVKRLYVMCYVLLVTCYLASFAYFLDAYFVHLPIHNAKYWFYGYREVVERIIPIQKNYSNIVFKQSYNQPYIYFLFYQKYDPARYQRQAKLVESWYGDVGLVEKLDNITFREFSWPVDGVTKGDLIIADPIVAPKNLIGKEFKIISEIKYPDNLETAFRIIEVE